MNGNNDRPEQCPDEFLDAKSLRGDPLAKMNKKAEKEAAHSRFLEDTCPAPALKCRDQSVFFFTDRPAIKDSGERLKGFGKDNNHTPLSDITFGKTSVDRPMVLPRMTACANEIYKTANPKETFEKIHSDSNDFLEDLDKARLESPVHKVVILNPGFATSFEHGADTAAAQKESLAKIGIDMPVVLYSPPCHDTMRGSKYASDEENFESSLVVHGAKTISDIEKKVGSNNVILIGFSLGNQNTTAYAFSRNFYGVKEPMYAQNFSRSDTPVKMVAPMINAICDNAKHTRFTYSLADRAEKFSGILHNNERTGNYAGKYIKIAPELQNRLELCDDSAKNNKISKHIYDPDGNALWIKQILTQDGEIPAEQK